MRSETRSATWLRILLIVLIVLPVAMIFLLPGGGILVSVVWFWLGLLICLWIMWALAARSAASAGAPPLERRMLDETEQPEVIRDLMNVRMATEQEEVRVFRGQLRAPPEEAFETLKQAFGSHTVPLLQKDPQGGSVILLIPKPVEQEIMERAPRTWVNWLLFGLTVLTTIWAGAAHQGVNLLNEPERFTVGLPYALGLLGILGLHEMGHFVAARRHGMKVTPPYFIPVPFALGTFGAFIRMRSPPEDRRALFDVAVAGPLAGLVIAIPVLLVGLQTSEVINTATSAPQGFLGGTSVGSSILFGLLAKLSLGPELLEGDVLRLSPLAFAGWLGLFVTALNLLPIGQLDGGHIARAMFGTRAGNMIGTIAMWALFLLALFVWPALMLWALIVFFIAGRGAPPLNDITRLSRGRVWLGMFSFFILLLILAPLPRGLW